MRLGSWSNAGLGFGLVFSLVDDFSVNARKIERQMQMLGGRATTMANSVETAMGRAKLGAAGLLVSLIGLAGWAKAAKVDAEFQNYELAFQSFLGTAERAHQVFEQIKQDAIANPKFSISGMEKANLLLISQGVAAETSMRTIRDLTTVLLGVGRGEPELQRVALAMEKIQAGGFLTGPQFRSLTTAGLPVVKMLRDIGIQLDPSHIAQAKITFEQLAEALHRSTQQGGAFGNVWAMMANNVSAKAAQIKEQGIAALASIGEAIRPVTLAILSIVERLLTAIQRFISTPLGKWLVRIAFALNVVLFAMSALLLISSLSKIAIFKMAGAFGANTQAAIMSAFATNGFTGALAAMGTALQAAFIEFLPIIAAIGLLYTGYKLLMNTDNGGLFMLGAAFMLIIGPVGLLVDAVLILIRSWREFNDVMNGTKAPANGFLGVLQRIGGIMHFIVAAWNGFRNTMEGGEIEVSKNLLATMDRLGVGQLARNLATWIGRIKFFWNGLKQGFSDTFNFLSKGILNFINVFRNGNDQLASWDDLLGKNNSNLEKWYKTGKMIGNFLAYAFTALIVSLAVLSVAMVANAIVGVISWIAWLAPMLAIIAVGYLIAAVIHDIAVALFGTEDAGQTSFSSITDSAKGTADKLGGLAPEFYTVGENLGTQLATGLKSAFDDFLDRNFSIEIPSLKSFFTEHGDYYHYVPGRSDLSHRYNTDDDANNERVSQAASNKYPLQTMAAMQQLMNGPQAMKNAFQNTLTPSVPFAMPNSYPKSGPTIINVHLDGKVISQSVIDTMKQNNATSYKNNYGDIDSTTMPAYPGF